MKEIDLCGINLTFPLLEFRKALKLLKLLGFSRTDITLNAEETTRHLCTYRETENPYGNGRKLLEILEEENLKQTDLFVFMGDLLSTALNNPDRGIREKNARIFCGAVEYAKACECNHMTILPGAYFDNGSMEMAARELKWRTDLAAEAGIALAVEAHIGSIADTPQKAMELLERTPGLTLTLDYSHFIKGGATQEEIDVLIPYASHMHFRNASKKSSQTIFAESEIDYIRVIQKIKEYGFTGDIALEFCSSAWEDQNRVDTIGETLQLKEYIELHW